MKRYEKIRNDMKRYEKINELQPTSALKNFPILVVFAKTQKCTLFGTAERMKKIEIEIR